MQQAGAEINQINIGEFLDINVAGSSGDIKQIRFASDDSQDGVPPPDEPGNWNPDVSLQPAGDFTLVIPQYYYWDASLSSGDWNAEAKTKKWSFATPGEKEVWVEIKDADGQIAKCFADISAKLPDIISLDDLPISDEWIRAFFPVGGKIVDITFDKSIPLYDNQQDDNIEIKVEVENTAKKSMQYFVNLYIVDFNGKIVGDTTSILSFLQPNDSSNVLRIDPGQKAIATFKFPLNISIFLTYYLNPGQYQVLAKLSAGVFNEILDYRGITTVPPEVTFQVTGKNNNGNAQYETAKKFEELQEEIIEFKKTKEKIENAAFPVFRSIPYPNPDSTTKINIVLVISSDSKQVPYRYKKVIIKTKESDSLKEILNTENILDRPDSVKLFVSLPSSAGGCLETYFSREVLEWINNFIEKISLKLVEMIFEKIIGKSIIPPGASFGINIVRCISEGYETILGEKKINGEDFIVYLPIMDSCEDTNSKNAILTVKALAPIATLTNSLMAGISQPGGVMTGMEATWEGKISEESDNEILLKLKESYDPMIKIKLLSPGELRVYDSQERVTGLVNGRIKEEIPNSVYDEENKTVIIFDPSDNYRYEVAGTDTGTYGLKVTSVKNEKVTTFNAIDIPTIPGQIHEFTVDWDVLSQGGEGVTLKIDLDSDGDFEQTINSDATLDDAPPTASPVAGTYTAAQNVTLTSAAAASINYTTDGTTPTCSTGTIYVSPISVNSSQTIKAISCYATGLPSAVASFGYTINIPSPLNSGGGGYIVPAPLQPTEFKAVRNADTIKLNWKNPTTNFSKVVIIRDTKTISPSLAGNVLRNYGTVVYEGALETYEDKGLDNNVTYYYAISAYNSSGYYSQPVIISSAAEPVKVLGIKIEYVDYSAYSSLYGLTSDLVQAITLSEAETIMGQKQLVVMDKTSQAIYDKIIKNYKGILTDQQKYSVSYFIQSGTPTTKILGAGERGGSVDSYLSAFGKLPGAVSDWQDVIKIANGRWPTQRNETKEKQAEQSFKVIYKRASNRDNPNDNAAVTVMAYGLRPSQRNLDSEKAAILSFKYFYKRSPVSAIDWDTVRAIAYSGAKR